MAEKKQNNLVKLTGLWSGTTQSGIEYLSGTLSASSRLVIFKNGKKNKPADPDYYAYLAPNVKKEN